MPLAALDIKDLRKTYKQKNLQVDALKGVNLQIEQGSYFGFLGPNGAGKSTLINILSGSVSPTSGSIHIMGRDLFSTPLEAKRFIGIVPQELNIDFFFTPYESLELMAGYYGVPPRERKTLEILEVLGLGNKAHAPARSLSGGMKRRLLIAKALVHDPHVLILDEPTAGVDIHLRQSLWEYITKLNKEKGTTIILTTHYLEEAESLCDKLAFIRQGEIVAHGKKKDLLKRLDKKTLNITVTKDFTGLTPATKEAFPDIQWNPQEQNLTVHYQPSKTSIHKLLESLKTHNIPFDDISTEEGSLDDLFLALTE